jgi:hypothetical protein
METNAAENFAAVENRPHDVEDDDDSQSAVSSSTSKTGSGSDMGAGTKSIKRGNTGMECKELSRGAGDETLRGRETEGSGFSLK